MIARLVASMWLALQVLPAVCAIVMARAPGLQTMCASVAMGRVEPCGAPEPEPCSEAPASSTRCDEMALARGVVAIATPSSDDCAAPAACESASHCCPLCEPICCGQPVAPSPRDPSREDTRRGLESLNIHFSPASHPVLTAERVGRLIPSGILCHYAVPGDEFRATTGVWLI